MGILHDIPSNACSTLTASLALVSKYGIPPFELQNVCARFEDTCSRCQRGCELRECWILTIRLLSSTSILLPSTTCIVLDWLFYVIKLPQAYKGKVLRVHRTRLYQELVSPAIQCIETLAVRDIEA